MENKLLGSVIINEFGNDKKRAFVVVREEGKFIYIADGRHRLMSSPKKKNKKHVTTTAHKCDLLGISTERDLWRFLKSLNLKQTI